MKTVILELVLVKGFQLILAVPNVSFRESLKLSVRVSPEVRVVPVIESPVLNGWRIVCLNPLDQTLSHPFLSWVATVLRYRF